MNNRILPYHITSTFALEYRLDSQMMNRLWEYISIARANEEELDYSKNLAGNISTELILKHHHIQNGEMKKKDTNFLLDGHTV